MLHFVQYSSSSQNLKIVSAFLCISHVQTSITQLSRVKNGTHIDQRLDYLLITLDRRPAEPNMN
jgi:hypothetical protein